MHPLIRERPLQELARVESPSQRSAAERPHRDDTKVQFGRQRQDAPLRLALERVVGHLDRVDAPGAHDLLQLAERAGRVVRRAQKADPVPGPLVLQPVEVLPPADEIVHLLEIDAAAEELELGVELAAGLRPRAGPDLRGDKRLAATVAKHPAQHALGPPVHRG